MFTLESMVEGVQLERFSGKLTPSYVDRFTSTVSEELDTLIRILIKPDVRPTERLNREFMKTQIATIVIRMRADDIANILYRSVSCWSMNSSYLSLANNRVKIVKLLVMMN